MNNFLFQAKQIKKTFSSDQTLIYEGELSIKRNCLTFITGDSGVGKSTLLHILAMTDRADKKEESSTSTCLKCHLKTNSGNSTYEVDYFHEYEKKSWNKRSAKIRSKHFGFLPQQGHLLHNLSVRENLELVFRLRGASGKNNVEKEITKVLKQVELQKMFDKKETSNLSQTELRRSPAYLSGGEAQRLAVARAIMCSPQVIFVDEPTTFLNKILNKKMIELFVEKVHRQECCVIIVTHQYEDFLKENFQDNRTKIHVDHFLLEEKTKEKDTNRTIEICHKELPHELSF